MTNEKSRDRYVPKSREYYMQIGRLVQEIVGPPQKSFACKLSSPDPKIRAVAKSMVGLTPKRRQQYETAWQQLQQVYKLKASNIKVPVIAEQLGFKSAHSFRNWRGRWEKLLNLKKSED